MHLAFDRADIGAIDVGAVRQLLLRPPLRVFDDGRQVFIEFPPSIAQGELPPLFVLGLHRRSAEVVNYRVRGRHMIVDRLFAAAELRLGGKRQSRVRITREGDR